MDSPHSNICTLSTDLKSIKKIQLGVALALGMTLGSLKAETDYVTIVREFESHQVSIGDKNTSAQQSSLSWDVFRLGGVCALLALLRKKRT